MIGGYSDTLATEYRSIPVRYVSDAPGFETVMIEVNKRLYLGQSEARFERIRAHISQVLGELQEYERLP